jgi:Bacterial PH domain
VTSEETATTTDGAPAVRPATFRAVPLPALVAVGFLALAVSPIAFLGGPWWLFYLLPIALGWWVIRTRTVVDAEALRVLSAWGSRRVDWNDVATLRVVDRGWVRAVRGEDAEQPLVGVRTRDLGRVAQASGGRITMPTPEEVELAQEHERELEAARQRVARLREHEAEDGAAESDATVPGETDERA